MNADVPVCLLDVQIGLRVSHVNFKDRNMSNVSDF